MHFFRVIVMFSIAALLLGCSKKDNNAITFAVGGAPNELDVWEQIAQDFQEKTGTRVIINRQPTDSDQRRQGLVIALKSKKSDPDVFLMDVAWIAQFAASQWLSALDSYMQKSDLTADVFFPRILSLTDRYNDALIALPIYVDGGMLYYRKDLLEKYGFSGPPETWEELVAFSRTVQEGERESNPSFYGFVWQGAQYEGLMCTFLEFAGSNEGGIVVNDGSVHIATNPNTEALSFMRKLIADYNISPPSTYTEMKEEEVRTFFQKGNALFERNWPYAWALHQKENSSVRGKVGIAPLPHFPSGESVSTLGGWHAGVSAFSDKKEDAWQFVEYITSAEVQKQLALKLGWNPGRRDVYTDSTIIAELPHFTELKTVFEHAQPRPLVPYYTQISEVLQRHLNSALAGKTTAEKALEAAEDEAQAIVTRYR